MVNQIPFKKPSLPRCCYQSLEYYMMGIPSPSMVFYYTFNPNNAMKKYNEKLRTYNLNVLKWKLNNRSMTRSEYKQYQYYLRKSSETTKQIKKEE